MQQQRGATHGGGNRRFGWSALLIALSMDPQGVIGIMVANVMLNMGIGEPRVITRVNPSALQ